MRLHNYPKFLQNLVQDNGERFDLAAVDILRDRERGVPRYNDFREALRMPRRRSFDELTPNPQWAKEIADLCWQAGSLGRARAHLIRRRRKDAVTALIPRRLALELTGSSLALGLVLMAAAIPRAGLMLVGGAMSDRFDPRSIMIAFRGLGLIASIVDLDFYDDKFRPGSYLRTHAEHMEVWH